MISNKKQFLFNLMSSYGSSIINVVLSFISVPIVLNYWDKELYGIWTIIVSFSTYISASGLGIDVSTGVLATKTPNYNAKKQIVKSGFSLLLICAILIGLVFLGITLIFPDWFKIIGKMSDTNYIYAKTATIIYFFGLVINLPFNTISNSLQSIGKAYVATLIGTLQIIFNFLIVVLVVSLKMTLPIYVLLISINAVFCSLIKMVLFIFYFNKGKREWDVETHELNGEFFDRRNNYKTILITGINMSIYGLAIMLIPNISNLIITNEIDVKSVVPYSISYKLFSTIAFFWNSLNVALAPIFGKEVGNNNWEWIEINFTRMFRTTISLSIFLICGVLWLSKPFIRIWTGSFENFAGQWLSLFLALTFFIYALTNVNLVVINSFNYLKNVWLISWGEGVIFIITAKLLISKIGIIGVPLGLFLGAFSVSSWAYPFVVYKRSNRRLKYDILYLIKNLIVFFISVILYLIVYCFVDNLVLQLICSGVGFFATTGLIIYCLADDVKKVLHSKIKRRVFV